jgi:hypothetical protein
MAGRKWLHLRDSAPGTGPVVGLRRPAHPVLRRAVLLLSLLALSIGLMTATAQASPTYRYNTGSNTVYVGNRADFYVIGYLFPGKYADVQQLETGQHGVFGYGRIGSTSNFGAWDEGHHCGWVQITDSESGTTLMTKGEKIESGDVCPPATHGTPATAEGLLQTNIFKSGTYVDGCGSGCVQNAVVLPQCHDLNVYANYDPSTGTFADADGTESPGRGTPGYGGVSQQSVTTPVAGFGTRFMTHDGNAVEIKDSSRPGEKTAWGFMHSECLAGELVGNPSRPPAATTYAPSELGGTTAKLNGLVNPNGNDTHYYFEYGATTGYGSTVPASPGMDLGSGSTGISTWNVISGLLGGATYHFRVVASSPGGITRGADQSFTEPTAPTVTSLSASEVSPTQAKLNGSVNPDGSDTHYYFEYGLSAGYGNSIPAVPGMDLGGGTAPIATWNVISGLQPGTVYHYRVVATNGAGTTFGSDQTFLTSGMMDVFWEGSNGQLRNEYLSGSGWSYSPIGEAGVMAGPPSAVRLPGGQMDVFWEGPNGQLRNEYWNGLNWSYSPLGEAGVMAGPPSAVVKSGGQMDVFWEGPNGQLRNEYWNGFSWSYSPLGEAGVMAGPPSAVVKSGGQMDVFWEGPGGQLRNEYWGEPGWSYSPLGEAGVMAGPPSAVVKPGGQMDVFWEGPGGQLRNEYWGEPGWSYSPLGEAGVMAGPPSAGVLPAGQMDVFWEGPNGQLRNEYWGEPGWSYSPLGEANVMAGGPSALEW